MGCVVSDNPADLLREAHELPFGPARTAMVDQVIARADAMGLRDLAFEARLHAITAYVGGGEQSRALAPFAWCMAEFDRDPDRFASHIHTLLWQFKPALAVMTHLPEIGLTSLNDLLEDMQRRWQAGGHSLHAVYSRRFRLAHHVGDLVAAREWFERWCAAPRDSLSDCVGCDPSAKAGWLAAEGRDDEAIAMAEPVLAGQLTCSEQPQGILTALALPLLRAGRLEQARDAHLRGYRLLRSRLADLADIAEHLQFCAQSGNEVRGGVGPAPSGVR
jgi:hypothetical protein